MFFLMLLAELSVVHSLGGHSVCLVSGFRSSIRTPLSRPSGSWCSSASLNMLAIGYASKSAEHLNNSAGMSSCPLARPLFSLPIAWFISAGVIR